MSKFISISGRNVQILDMTRGGGDKSLDTQHSKHMSLLIHIDSPVTTGTVSNKQFMRAMRESLSDKLGYDPGIVMTRKPTVLPLALDSLANTQSTDASNYYLVSLSVRSLTIELAEDWTACPLGCPISESTVNLFNIVKTLNALEYWYSPSGGNNKALKRAINKVQNATSKMLLDAEDGTLQLVDRDALDS